MEEVIDELRERNEPVPVPLELPDEETLVEIQEQILIHLPYALRDFLLTVSDVVYGHLEPVTASDPHSHTFLPEVTATSSRYLSKVPPCTLPEKLALSGVIKTVMVRVGDPGCIVLSYLFSASGVRTFKKAIIP